MTTKDELMNFYHNIHNLLRNNEGLAEERALNNFGYILALKFLEKIVIEKKINGIKKESLYSSFCNSVDEEEIHVSVKQAILNFYKTKITSEFFDKLEIKKAKTTYLIVKELNKIDFNKIDEDMRGKLYEYFIGREPTTVKGLGQFFTNREIVDLVVGIIDKLGYLKLKDKKIPTICDPTCGTGGFLFGLVNKLIKKYPDLNWNEQQKRISGYDVSPSCIRSTKLNLLCLTGVIFDNITQRNTLSSDLDLDKYDIIFGNPPYGGDRKNKDFRTKYEDASEEIKKIGIIINLKEAIFSQLFMIKCGEISAIVLPEGFYFNSSKSYVKLRKYLLENYNVLKIIDIPKDAFENTGTKTSVIIFTNGITKKISFIDFTTKKEIININIDNIIERNYNLNWKLYYKKIEKIDDSYKIVKLGDICNFESSKINSNVMDNKGIYPFYNGKVNSPIGTHSIYNFNKKEYLAIIKGGGTGYGKYGDQIGLGKVFYLNGKTAISNGLYVMTCDNKKINTKYLYYYLQNIKNEIMDLANYTTGLGNINMNSIKNLKISIPKSIEYQKKIVDEIEHLDNYNKICKKSIETIELYLYDEIKRIVEDNKCVTKKIKDICEFKKKSRRTAGEGCNSGKYPFYICSEKEKFLDECDYKDEMLIIGDGGNPRINIDFNFSCSSHNYLLIGDKIFWIYYFLKSNMKILKKGFSGATIKNISKTYIENIEIPVPKDKLMIGIKETHKHILATKKIFLKNKLKFKKLMKRYFN